jgi:microcystin-dependent protein
MSTEPISDVPVGTVVMWAGAINQGVTVPSGWLLCDGSYVPTNAFPELYSFIGDNWGAAGAGTFALPNFVAASATTLRGPIGAGGSGPVLGATTTTIYSNGATVQGSGLGIHFIIRAV